MSFFSEPPPEGGLDLVTNRQGAIFLHEAIVTIYSLVVHQPSAISHQEVWFWSEPAVSTSAYPATALYRGVFLSPPEGGTGFSN